jgi:hypothetical protein
VLGITYRLHKNGQGKEKPLLCQFKMLGVLNLNLNLGVFSVLKRFAQILALAVPLILVACNGTTTTTTAATGASTGTTTTTSASYAGTYTGTTTGVNGGPTTMAFLRFTKQHLTAKLTVLAKSPSIRFSKVP